MKTKIIYLLFASVILFFSCRKKITVKDALTNLTISNKNIEADGSTTVDISVKLTKDASADRRSVVFATTSGNFSGVKTVTVTANFVNGDLIASTTLKAPTSPGKIGISVNPTYDSPISEFTLSDTIVATVSLPTAMELIPSSFGITANNLNNISLLAKLKNSGKGVSKGIEVKFQDLLLNYSSANGNFTESTVSSSDSSLVRTTYSSSTYSIGTIIKIKSTVYENGSPTNIADSIQISINQ